MEEDTKKRSTGSREGGIDKRSEITERLRENWRDKLETRMKDVEVKKEQVHE